MQTYISVLYGSYCKIPGYLLFSSEPELSHPDPMLNPALDLRSLAEEFSRKNRIQIHDLLVPEAAEALYRCLEDQVPWGLAYIDGEKNKLLAAEEVARYTASDWALLDQRVQVRGPDKFQFLYNSYMMITAYKERRDPNSILHRMVEWINSPAYVQLLRAVTGVANIQGADAQATRYMPGHFLRKHTDQVNNQYREVAYVINLTKDWQADWGGLLQFVEEDGTVTETYLPTFNSLSLFRVPMWHHVNLVTPAATRARYAITGWGLSRPRSG